MRNLYSSKTPQSRRYYERARKVLPGGVSYSIRYFEPYPFYTARADGSKIFDVDGNTYVDFWLGHTALILGHNHPAVVEAVRKQLEHGVHFGTSHRHEIELAEQVARMVPTVEMVRFTNSGTEANMYAIRLARAYSRKNRIAKFEGGWHGGYDALQKGIKYPFGTPDSAGLTEKALEDTIILPFNDIEGVRSRIKTEKVASITIEPVLGAGGVIPAQKEFLKALREFCSEKDILLIFDEVITGFRLAPGGGQEFYGVKPDITVLGKILGGGFPIGAFGGPKEIMSKIDAVVYKRPNYSFHGGTFSANPMSMTAGLSTLKILENGRLASRLNKLGDSLRKRVKEIFQAEGVPVQVTGVSSLFYTHFTEREVTDAYAAAKADRNMVANYHSYLIAHGVFLLPTHEGVLSIAHSADDVGKLLLETEKYARQCKVHKTENKEPKVVEH